MPIEKWTNQIHQGKCEELIPLLPSESVDIVITSPPYNVNLGNNKYNKNPYDIYNDNLDHWLYIQWLHDIFAKLKPKMVRGGRVCINIGDGANGKVPTHSDIIQFMVNAENTRYLLKTVIIWMKHQIGSRTAWGSWKSPANPSFPTPFEYILVFCKNTQNKEGDKKRITVSKDEFIKNSLAVWNMKTEGRMKQFGHPAMFPKELPIRLIQQLSYENDIVLDIFSGLGTTCLAAEMLKRRWIGFELSKRYVKRSRRRIKKYTDQSRLF